VRLLEVQNLILHPLDYNNLETGNLKKELLVCIKCDVNYQLETIETKFGLVVAVKELLIRITN